MYKGKVIQNLRIRYFPYFVVFRDRNLIIDRRDPKVLTRKIRGPRESSNNGTVDHTTSKSTFQEALDPNSSPYV